VAGESAGEVARRHREKIARLERSAERWQRGADGEAATAAVLDQLPEGWTVLHDVRWPGRPRANIDHVVIGPCGVFVIDSKNWSGEVVVRDGVLRQGGRPREEAVTGAAEAALAVARLTTAVTVHQVHPVLCLVREEPVTGWARDVMVTSMSTLATMLLSRPLVVHPTRVTTVVADLRRWLVPATEGPTPAHPAVHPLERRPRVGDRRRQQPRTSRAGRRRLVRRRLRRLLVGVVAAAALVVGAPYLPRVTEPLAELLTDHLAPAPSADPATDQGPVAEPALTEQQRRERRQERRERQRQRDRRQGGASSSTP
jgi:hypothetical protein